jgi:hypothetical protein
MTNPRIDPAHHQAAHHLAVGSVLAVLTVGAVTLVQATPSWWRLLLVPLAVLPLVTLRRPALALVLPAEPWLHDPLPRRTPAPVYDLQAARALRYGWVDPDDDGVPQAA